jgi:hypothetical protein
MGYHFWGDGLLTLSPTVTLPPQCPPPFQLYFKDDQSSAGFLVLEKGITLSKLNPWIPLDPGSGICNRFFSGSRISDPGSRISDPGSRISDPGSRILNLYFGELSDNFLGEKFYNSLKIGPNFFFSISKLK